MWNKYGRLKFYGSSWIEPDQENVKAAAMTNLLRETPNKFGRQSRARID